MRQKEIPNSSGTRSKTLYTFFIMFFLHTFHVHRIHSLHERTATAKALLSTFLLWKLLQVLMHSHCLAFYQQIKFLYPKFRGVTGLNQKLAKSLGLLTFKAFIKRPVVYVRLFKNVNKNGLLIKTQKKKEKKQGNKTEKFDITTWKHLLQNFPELPITQCRLHKRQNGRGYCKAIWLRTISK